MRSQIAVFTEMSPGEANERCEYPVTDVTVHLIGTDGNAFALLGKVRRVLRHAGYDTEFIDRFTKEAMSADYGHLLATTMKYVEVE